MLRLRCTSALGQRETIADKRNAPSLMTGRNMLPGRRNERAKGAQREQKELYLQNSIVSSSYFRTPNPPSFPLFRASLFNTTKIQSIRCRSRGSYAAAGSSRCSCFFVWAYLRWTPLPRGRQCTQAPARWLQDIKKFPLSILILGRSALFEYPKRILHLKKSTKL